MVSFRFRRACCRLGFEPRCGFFEPLLRVPGYGKACMRDSVPIFVRDETALLDLPEAGRWRIHLMIGPIRTLTTKPVSYMLSDLATTRQELFMLRQQSAGWPGGWYGIEFVPTHERDGAMLFVSRDLLRAYVNYVAEQRASAVKPDSLHQWLGIGMAARVHVEETESR